MEQQPYQISSTTSLSDLIGRPLRTTGCILLYCTEGRAVMEWNFTDRPFRKGDMTVIFSDTLFTIKKASPGFKTRYFELSVGLTDETTFTATNTFLDWLYEHPIFPVHGEKKRDMELWLSAMDWIEANAKGKYRNMMLRNQWHNFFLGLEAILKDRLADRDIKTISSNRTLFDKFCKLLFEHCRQHHEVRFYADRLCITPYYLSRITRRTFAATPKELINRQIIMEIKSLLTSTEMSVKEIADLYHFESSSYLSRFFRRHIGMTPTQYREKNS